MRRRILVLSLGGLLFGGAGLANAAEPGPIGLTDAQMDRVAASGYVASWSSARASVVVGLAATSTRTSAFKAGPVATTNSTSVGVAIGLGASAQSNAGGIAH